MAKRSTQILDRIENYYLITRNTDPEFLLKTEQALLLTLLEYGMINDTQYRYAERKLKDLS